MNKPGRTTICKDRHDFIADAVAKPSSGCMTLPPGLGDVLHVRVAVPDGRRLAPLRAAWLIVNGAIDRHVWLAPKGDCEEGCFNPAHHKVVERFGGAWGKYGLDHVAALEACKGEKNWRAKLTEKKVRKIYALRGSGRTQADIGAEFGVDVSVISHIWGGRRWAWLTAIIDEENEAKKGDMKDRRGSHNLWAPPGS